LERIQTFVLCFNRDRPSFPASLSGDFSFGIGIQDGPPPSHGTNAVLLDEAEKYGQGDDSGR
jgi:hypothetical protein